MPAEAPKRDLTNKILFALAKGALVLTAIPFYAATQGSYSKTARRWGYEILEDAFLWNFSDFREALERTEEQKRLAHAVSYIRQRRYVRAVLKNGKLVLEITEKGKRRAVAYDMQHIRIVPRKPWDGIWRVVLFDIPEKYRRGRDVFRAKLRNLGFFQLQKSAFVLPYPCHDEIDAIVQAYYLAPYVTMFETKDLGYQEPEAFAFFSLKPKKEK